MQIINLPLELYNPFFRCGDASPHLLHLLPQLADDVEVSINTTLDHLLVLEDFLLPLLQPGLDAPLLDKSLQIFLMKDTVLHPNNLRVLLHLSEVRVDDVDDELVLGGTRRSHGT